MGEMPSNEPAKFETWAIVELMGRQTLAGKVTEQVIAGQGFLRIDVPECIKSASYGSDSAERTRQAYTRWVSPSSVYAINPCSEELARAAVASWRVADPMPLEFRPERTLPAAPSDLDPERDDERSPL